jgi:hypothetical protein
MKRIKRKLGGEEVEGVDVMKDDELNLEEIDMRERGGVGREKIRVGGSVETVS